MVKEPGMGNGEWSKQTSLRGRRHASYWDVEQEMIKQLKPKGATDRFDHSPFPIPGP
jgi:hypothetical protein